MVDHPQGDFGAAVHILYSYVQGRPIGTCFAYERRGIYLTAKHCLAEEKAKDLRILRQGGYRWATELRPRRSYRHPILDLAVLVVQLASNDHPFCLHQSPLVESVASFGYTLRSDREDVQPRLMKGYVHSTPPKGLELSFPAFPGHSGAPVLDDNNREGVCGVVSGGTEFYSRLGHVELTTYMTRAVSLESSVADWIDKKPVLYPVPVA